MSPVRIRLAPLPGLVPTRSGPKVRDMATDTQQVPRESWREDFDPLSNGMGTVKATDEISRPHVGGQFIFKEPLRVTGITYDEKKHLPATGLPGPRGPGKEPK